MKPEFHSPDNGAAAAATMFSKLPQPPHGLPIQPLPHRPHFHPSVDDLGGLATKPAEDGATIELARRPRGRPPGSKNKPKPPLIIAREAEPAMRPFVLEVSDGADIVDAVSAFSRRRSLGLCVLAGSGAVADVTLRQSPAGGAVTIPGRYDILSLSAVLLAPESPLPTPAEDGFSVSLGGGRGQIVGGKVSGRLVAAGTVYVMAASFNSPSYHRLAADGEEAGSSSVSGNEVQSPAVEIPIYGGPLASDVIWSSGGRQQQPSY